MSELSLRLEDFDFELPEALIALRPAEPRSAARLLLATPGRLSDHHVADLPGLLRADDVLVYNNTRVIPARLRGARQRGAAVAKIEATLIERLDADRWRALMKPMKRLRLGEEIEFGTDPALRGELIEIGARGEAALRFNQAGAALDRAIERLGVMPLPPYIAGRREVDDRDRADYQTIFARHSGAVAAPTASLHFDDALLAALDARGIARAPVTLHVGAGTFLPVTEDDPRDHKIHREWGELTEETADHLRAARAAGRRIIALGTTALRLLEAASEQGEIRPFRGETGIYILPGRRFNAVRGLMTNFHLPRSTLFMLVCALMGRAKMIATYRHAIDKGYRFYSYGDANLLLPDDNSLQ